MTRSGTKSRSDTRGSKVSVQAPSPQSQEAPRGEDVVPGRLSQTEWGALLRLEDTAHIVEELVGELMANVMEQCLKTHVRKQVTRVL